MTTKEKNVYCKFKVHASHHRNDLKPAFRKSKQNVTGQNNCCFRLPLNFGYVIKAINLVKWRVTVHPTHL